MLTEGVLTEGVLLCFILQNTNSFQDTSLAVLFVQTKKPPSRSTLSLHCMFVSTLVDITLVFCNNTLTLFSAFEYSVVLLCINKEGIGVLKEHEKARVVESGRE